MSRDGEFAGMTVAAALDEALRQRDMLLGALTRLLSSTEEGTSWQEESDAQAQANDAIAECEGDAR